MKKVLTGFLVLLATVVLVACTGDKAKDVTYTISGIDNVTLEFGDAFNVKTGVTVKGSDDKDYTDKLVFTSTSSLVKEDGSVDTKTPGSVTVLYKVVIDDKEMTQKFRTIKINEPAKVAGYLQNPKMEDGIAYWNGDAVNQGDGGVIDLMSEDGTLRADYTAGWGGPHTARFGQVGIATELGKTYEITFKAKAATDGARKINIQVGELVIPASAPWFYDFLPGVTIQPEVTEEWTTVSFKVTINPLEKDRAGITQADGKYTKTALLIGLGAMGQAQEYNGLVSTIWFDDFTMELSTPDADTTKPVITVGNKDRKVVEDTTFDVQAGVSALDNVDGDLTSKVTAVIKKGDTVVEAVNTSTVGDVYTITYSVTDKAGNKADDEVVTVTIISADGPLIAGLDDAEHKLELSGLGNDAASLTYADGKLTMVVNTVGVEAYTPHYAYMLEGLAAGTYTFTLKITGDVARHVRANILVPDWGYQSLIEGSKFDQLLVKDEEATISITFTVQEAITNAVKIELDFGTLGGELISLPGTFVISQVTLEKQ